MNRLNYQVTSEEKESSDGTPAKTKSNYKENDDDENAYNKGSNQQKNFIK